MPIYKRTKDKRTGKVTKTLKNPFTGKTRVITKSPTGTSGSGKKKKVVTDSGKYKTSRHSKEGDLLFRHKTKEDPKTGKITNKPSRKFLGKKFKQGGMINRYRGGGIIQHD